jgi:hypothetical protein
LNSNTRNKDGITLDGFDLWKKGNPETFKRANELLKKLYWNGVTGLSSNESDELNKLLDDPLVRYYV